MTQKPHWGITTHDIELSREYGPNDIFWKLTPLAVKRMNDNTLPTLPAIGYQVLRYLENLEFAEEDELATHLDITLVALRSILARLDGYGYVQQVELQSPG